MQVNSIDKWNLLDYKNTKKHEQLQRVTDHSAWNNDNKSVTVSISEEGLRALHGQKLRGAVDTEEMKRMEEIIPKLSINPEDEFYWALRNDMSQALEAIKEQKGSYDLDDLLSIRMEAYANQYNSLLQSYENGTRDIYVCDGEDENGKLQYHQVTMEEDIAYLDAAFSRIAESMAFSARSKEILMEINEKFGGQQIDLELPEDYEDKLVDILESAMQKYKAMKNNEEKVSASNLVIQFLNRDTEFAEVMRQLFKVN